MFLGTGVVEHFGLPQCPGAEGGVCVYCVFIMGKVCSQNVLLVSYVLLPWKKKVFCFERARYMCLPCPVLYDYALTVLCDILVFLYVDCY